MDLSLSIATMKQERATKTEVLKQRFQIDFLSLKVFMTQTQKKIKQLQAKGTHKYMWAGVSTYFWACRVDESISWKK